MKKIGKEGLFYHYLFINIFYFQKGEEEGEEGFRLDKKSQKPKTKLEFIFDLIFQIIQVMLGTSPPSPFSLKINKFKKKLKFKKNNYLKKNLYI